MPSAPDWQKNPTRPGGGTTGASVAFIRTAGSVLARPRQFGPSTRIPADRASATSRRCASAPRRRVGAGTGVGEARAEHHEPVHPLRTALLDDVGDPRRGHRHDGEIHRVRDVGHRSVRPNALHRQGFRVDRVHGTGEVPAQQVDQDRVADLGLVGGGADHGDRARRQQAGDGPCLGVLFARDQHRAGRHRRADVEPEIDDAGGVFARHRVAGVEEDPHHRPVLAEHLRGEPGDTPLLRGGGQVLEQDRAESAALLVVLDGERHLGPIGVGRVGVIAPRPDDDAAGQCDQADPPARGRCPCRASVGHR